MKYAYLAVPAALLAGCAPMASAPEPVGRSVEPVPSERRLMEPTPEAIREYVEGVVTDRFGTDAVRRANGAASSVMAASIRGRFGSGGPNVNVAIRGAGGWSGWRSGRAVPLAPQVSREIDRLLASPGLWAEPDRFPAMDCPDSGAHLLVIRHAGRSKVTRQSCSPANQIGRLLTTALDERVPD